MRFPNTFSSWNGSNRKNLKNTKIFILQWNTGKNKNFIVEDCGAGKFQQNVFTIPGKGDMAMITAINKAYEIAKTRYGIMY